jgi:hypothetical protein
MDEERTTLSDDEIVTGQQGDLPRSEIMDVDETDADTDTEDADDADDTDADTDASDADSDTVDPS